jgi:hypothetical protein
MIAPGRDLDILIAQQIFKVKKIYYADWDAEKHSPLYIPSGKPWRTHHIDARPVPQFSTNIAAAWQVVERMHDLGWWLDANAYFSDDAGCNAGFTPKNTTGWNGRPDHAANAPTLPHAICLAALKAVGYEESAHQKPS